MILLRDYDQLVQYRFNPDNREEPPSGIIRINPQDVPLFFKLHGSNNKKYIIVSFDSDYGVDYQKNHHPNMDLLKMVHYYKWDQIQNRKDAYVALGLGPACVAENCNINDNYSVKVYSFTHATFNEEPDNIVRWYSTNVNVNHSKIIGLPIGYHDGIVKIIDQFMGKEKPHLCYVNYRNHTMERVHLSQYFRTKHWCKVVNESVTTEEYLQDIANHKFTICPPGVGYDTFRVYESIKLGTIPIVLNSVFNNHLRELPVLFVDDYKSLTPEYLEEIYNSLSKYNWNWDKLTLGYWANLIEQDKKFL